MSPYDEFVRQVAAITLVDRASPSEEMIVRRTSELERNGLSARWCTGGVTGGSCWGGEPNIPVEPDPEPDITFLDDVLGRFCPDLPYLRYRNLIGLTELSRSGSADYYGNREEYTVRTLRLRVLYDFLCADGYLAR